LPVDAIVQRASYRDTKNGAPAAQAKRYGLVTVSLAGADGNARLANFERIEMLSPQGGARAGRQNDRDATHQWWTTRR